MARARNIKPGFFTNDTLAEVPPLGRILFQGLWCHADREGRLEDRPRKIKAEILPYDDCDADELLNALAARGFVLRYQVGESRYIQVVNFTKHQNPHIKELASTIPAPTQHQTGTVLEPEKQEPARLIPDSLNLIPDSSSSQDLATLDPEPQTQDLLPVDRPKKNLGTTRAREAKPAPSSETWDAYAAAYRQRYGVDPVRNAKVNGQLANVVNRLGGSEAPAVASFYVRHNFALYVRAKHPVDLLLRDCEGLRTEWATGRTVTNTEAQQQDRKQNTVNAFAPLLAEAQAREANGKH